MQSKSSSKTKPHPISSGLLHPGPSRGTWAVAGLNGETGVVDGSATGVLLYHRDPAAASRGRRRPATIRVPH